MNLFGNEITENITLTDIAIAVVSAATIGKTRTADDSLFDHSMRVYKMVKHLWPDDKIAQIAALLHDLVEDTKVTLEYIESYFGYEIAIAVGLVTRQSGEDYHVYMKRLIQSRNVSAIRVKLCDAIDNSSLSIKAVKTGDVKLKTWLLWRIKYRKIAGKLSDVLYKLPCTKKERNAVITLMPKMMYVWARMLDIEAIRYLRDGIQPVHNYKFSTFKACMDTENSHLVDDSWCVIPWGYDVELKHGLVDSNGKAWSSKLSASLLNNLDSVINSIA